MAPLVSAIDINRPQDEVFAYVADPSTFVEWQAAVVGGSVEGGATPALESKCVTTRRIGGAERDSTSEVTKLGPPTSWAVHGIDGPIRGVVDVTVEPVNGTARSRVTIALDFEGHGIGKLLVPLVVRRQARGEMPANLKRLKQRLEPRNGAAAAVRRRPRHLPPGVGPTLPPAAVVNPVGRPQRQSRLAVLLGSTGWHGTARPSSTNTPIGLTPHARHTASASEQVCGPECVRTRTISPISRPAVSSGIGGGDALRPEACFLAVARAGSTTRA